VPVIKAESLTDEMMNKLKTKWFGGKELPSKINIWGEPVPRVPEGRNAYMWYFFDMFKKEELNTNRFGYELFELYNLSGDERVFPPSLKKDMSGIKLTEKQYEELSILVGRRRKQFVEPLLFDGQVKSMGYAMGMKMLQNQYRAGFAIGLQEFLQLYPEMQTEQMVKKLNELQRESWTEE
jgi:hypothetical protein